VPSPSPPRHHRQALLPQVGPEGQARLAASHAVIVGLGALGTVCAEWLCRAGVGHLTLIDRDIVEPTNLQRQTLYTESDARDSLPKAEAARARLLAIDPTTRIDALITDLNPSNALALLTPVPSPQSPSPVLLDATDNFTTRYLLNDLAIRTSTPLVYAGVIATRALQMTVLPGVTPCLRCVFPEPPAHDTATCDTVGVLGPAVGLIASLQSAEALKLLLNDHDAVARGLFEADLWRNTARRLDTGAPDPDCPCCAHRRFDFLEGDRASAPVTLCGRSSVQVGGSGQQRRIDLDQLAQRLAHHGEFRATRFLVRGTLAHERGENDSLIELTVFPDARAIVHNTTRPDRARALYAKYIGA